MWVDIIWSTWGMKTAQARGRENSCSLSAWQLEVGRGSSLALIQAPLPLASLDLRSWDLDRKQPHWLSWVCSLHICMNQFLIINLCVCVCVCVCVCLCPHCFCFSGESWVTHHSIALRPNPPYDFQPFHSPAALLQILGQVGLRGSIRLPTGPSGKPEQRGEALRAPRTSESLTNNWFSSREVTERRDGIY